MARHLLALLLGGLLAACASAPPTPEARLAMATSLTDPAGWSMAILPTGTFHLASFQPREQRAGDSLTIYIEGDGMAWISRTRPANDPTPKNPVALKLALRHDAGPVAWLGRPCQYVLEVDTPICERQFWTSARFADEVVRATDDAISKLKQAHGAKELVLVGFSGGGAVAALVAARRTDVTRLVTVAGNLDHDLWTRSHKISPLRGSLNPADFWSSLIGVKQLHLVGGEDRIIDKNIAESFRSRFPESGKPEVRVIRGFSHSCCWEQRWPELLSGPH